jgi:cell volume regulation protein A
MAIFEVVAGARLEGAPLKEMRFPEQTLLAAVYTQGRWERPTAAPVRAGELVCFVAPPQQLSALAALCGATSSGITGREEQDSKKRKEKPLSPFFGDFTLSGESLLGDIAALYGIPVEAADAGLSLHRYIRRATRELPVVGDRVHLEPLDLVVKAMEGEHITQVGLVFPPREADSRDDKKTDKKIPARTS